MKNFYTTVTTLLLFFFLILGIVVATAFARKSGSTGIDPAQICKLRQTEKK